MLRGSAVPTPGPFALREGRHAELVAQLPAGPGHEFEQLGLGAGDLHRSQGVPGPGVLEPEIEA